MLKKLLVITLIGLTSSFVYAEEKKVTENMLIGIWRCVVSTAKMEVYNKNGDLEEVQDPISDVKLYYADYKKQSNSIMLSVNQLEPVQFELNDNRYNTFQQIGECENDSATDFKINPKYTYISDNEYKVETIIQIRKCRSKELYGNRYTENICTRIK